MKYWLTTHYPHPVPDDLPWHVYLQREHNNAVAGMAIGDHVFFYEYKTRKRVRGDRERPPGREGIVRLARVSSAIYPRDVVVTYADGVTSHWSWGVKTDQEDADGFVPRMKLLPVINHKPGSNLRGFNRGTGIIQLKDSQAEELFRMFKERL